MAEAAPAAPEPVKMSAAAPPPSKPDLAAPILSESVAAAAAKVPVPRCCACAREEASFDAEEVVVRTAGCLYSGTRRVPYADIGSIEYVSCCGGAVVTMSSRHVRAGALCDSAGVSGLYQALLARVRSKGSISQMRRWEQHREKLDNLMGYVDNLNTKLSITMDKLGIKALQWSTSG